VTPLQALALAAQVLAAVSAVLLARRRAGHVPAAVALVLLAAGNLLDVPILAALTPYPVEPWEGASRALVYVDGALSLSYYAIVAGLPVALAASPERRRFAVAIVAGVWLLASVVLAALYPSPIVRGASLQRVYFAADLIGLFVATIAILTRGRANIAAKRSPDAAFALALSMATFDAGILLVPFSPWRLDLFGSSYFGPQLVVMVFFAVVTAVQVIAWKLSRGST
jgi:hypothetical protein